MHQPDFQSHDASFQSFIKRKEKYTIGKLYIYFASKSDFYNEPKKNPLTLQDSKYAQR